MSESTKRAEVARIEEELRALRVRDPRPALRDRVIEAEAQAATSGKRRRFGGWGVEATLAASIGLVIVLTAFVTTGRPPSPAAASAAEVDAATRDACRLLDREPQDWACRRLALGGPASGVARGWGPWVDGQSLEGGMP